jgi:hypothetical protein
MLIGLLSGMGGGVIAVVLTIVGSVKAVLICRFAWQIIVGAFGAVVVAVIYHDLRAAREGIDVERMAAVFD